jgi:hypothetical protein
MILASWINAVSQKAGPAIFGWHCTDIMTFESGNRRDRPDLYAQVGCMVSYGCCVSPGNLVLSRSTTTRREYVTPSIAMSVNFKIDGSNQRWTLSHNDAPRVMFPLLARCLLLSVDAAATDIVQALVDTFTLFGRGSSGLGLKTSQGETFVK